ncbi:LamG-like jellyroll fold domain-containing protein [Marinoscillum sp. MHG1-6]|uniref:LamG-like jellyroll fold domain-containing protein n=1 Tax=Marinoscillum sp. MHG1-6 TaxID=2959627 RepID=UPI002157A50C|nr:LamG-like jellyroll fold domain-containing protein [Marinoscillum sp. MHG1-6]
MKRSIYLILLLATCVSRTLLQAQQAASSSDYLIALPEADREVPYDVTDPGISKTVAFGADLAWADEQNFRRNILFMGRDQVDMVRASFQPSYPLVNDTDLTADQIADLDWRLELINTYMGANIDLALNCDHKYIEATGRYVNTWYVGVPSRWEQLIKVSAQRYLDAGHNIVTIGAFNEPDYGWDQGSFEDMYNITSLLNNNAFFDGIRLSGGNTLNNDNALSWYTDLIPAGVNEGNTHQLAGSFDTYANFFSAVRSNGHHATADELHNIVEALVGYEYGMQTGIWWADVDLAAGEMVKAFDGERIGYAEHRANWTAAAVYRHPDGKVQAFGGTSERQAYTTSYRFISKDRPVYYDGHGPQYEYVLEMPGGIEYGKGQTNAERVINITWGDDIQPEINGKYKLVNRKSGLVLGATGADVGSNIQQGSYTGSLSQQWEVYPVHSRIGGDFSYYRITSPAGDSLSLDLVNFSLDNGGNIHQWKLGNGGNQQWYLDYAEDGWFYIRSRESSHCLDVNGASTMEGANVIQWEKNGGTNQQWRFIPVDAAIEFNAPFANPGLTATAQSSSILLEWPSTPGTDIAGYTILRSETQGGQYNTIARNVVPRSFVDNNVVAGTEYFYVIKTVDYSLNSSGYSNEVSATITDTDDMVALLSFEGNTRDTTIHLQHGATAGGVNYGSGIKSSKAIELDGVDDFIKLSPGVANHQEISVAAWVKWNGGADWQRIFDFGNDESEYMMLTPSVGSKLRFAINYNGEEKLLEAPALTEGEWHHVAITISGSKAFLYVDGEPRAFSLSFYKTPMDFQPVFNYIGRSQFADPAFNGSIDDFKVYNYALAPEAVASLADTTEVPVEALNTQINAGGLSLWPVPADDELKVSLSPEVIADGAELFIYNLNGKLVKQQVINSNKAELDVSGLQNGIYLLEVHGGRKVNSQKVLIRH